MNRLIGISLFSLALVGIFLTSESHSNCHFLFNSSPKARYSQIYDQALNRLSRVFSEKNSLACEPTDFSIEVRAEPHDSVDQYHLILRHGESKLAFAAYSILGTTLRYDILVKEPYQRMGISLLFLSAILKRHPKIETIPSRMQWGDSSDNADIFIRRLFGRVDKRSDFPYGRGVERMNARDLMQFRTQTLEAFNQMPYTRILRKAELAQIQKIVIRPDEKTISFVVSRGTSAPGETVIILSRSTGGFYEVTPDGKRKKVGYEDTLLGDYEDLPDAYLPDAWL